MLHYHDYIEPLLKKTYQEQSVTVHVPRRRRAFYAACTLLYRRCVRLLRAANSRAPRHDVFIAVYEFTVIDGMQQPFRQAWASVTEEIYQQCGSYGSRLHCTDNPTVFIGYAQWPSRESWAGSKVLQGRKYQRARQQMREWTVSTSLRYCMTVCDDRLI